MFSPHANLHLKAVELAIDHTEYFFDQLRSRIGDREFAHFLDLEVCHSDIDVNATVTLANLTSVHLTNENKNANKKDSFLAKIFKL